MNDKQEARLVDLQRKTTLTDAEKAELRRLQADMDRALDRGARAAERGETGTRGAMPMVLGKKRGGMIMKKRFEEGGDVDYDKDTDPEAQKVYRSDLSEIKRTPARKKAKPAAKKAASKRDDVDSVDRKEQRRAIMSGFGPNGYPSRAKTAMPTRDDAGDFSYKKGGSVGSASRRADGIATKGKTKGRII